MNHEKYSLLILLREFVAVREEYGGDSRVHISRKLIEPLTLENEFWVELVEKYKNENITIHDFEGAFQELAVDGTKTLIEWGATKFGQKYPTHYYLPKKVYTKYLGLEREYAERLSSQKKQVKKEQETVAIEAKKIALEEQKLEIAKKGSTGITEIAESFNERNLIAKEALKRSKAMTVINSVAGILLFVATLDGANKTMLGWFVIPLLLANLAIIFTNQKLMISDENTSDYFRKVFGH